MIETDAQMARCILLLTALAIAPVAVLHAADPSISFTLDKPGQVSLGVYKQGRLLRELLRGEPKEAGEHSVDWDGLDRYGNAMPPGDYEWRLLRNDGFRAEYLLSIGVNPRSAPYDPWVGNHQAATAVTVDPKGACTPGLPEPRTHRLRCGRRSMGARSSGTTLVRNVAGRSVRWRGREIGCCNSRSSGTCMCGIPKRGS